jgi:hypothetical protein
MKTPSLVLACVAAATASVASATAACNWAFSPVKVIQARVQGDKPMWDAEHSRFVSAYYTTFDEKYSAVMDTVNTAAVEGAFKYVQAECIDSSVVSSCKRKNNIKYVVFYKTTIVQPRASIAYYSNASDTAYAIEHCPFMAMDGGQCDPNDDGTFPDICNQYIGADGQPDLGFCIGGTLQDSEPIAPYPHNYWFSYPNSCPQEKWAAKTATCRAEQAGGLCPVGVAPDGVNCTFSYEILGYVPLDDVVGITSMVNPNTGANYANYYEFCMAGGVEFQATVDANGGVAVTQSIPFWKDPGNATANSERIATLTAKYNALVKASPTTSDGGSMVALPSISSLKTSNPPCYKNSRACANSRFGCRRSYYSQVCEVCTARAADCVVKPKSYTFRGC